MVRVKRGNVARNHRKKILKIAKGFRGAHSKLFRVANQLCACCSTAQAQKLPRISNRSSRT